MFIYLHIPTLMSENNKKKIYEILKCVLKTLGINQFKKKKNPTCRNKQDELRSYPDVKPWTLTQGEGTQLRNTETWAQKTTWKDNVTERELQTPVKNLY